MARTPAQIIGHDALTQLIFEGYAVVPREPSPEMSAVGKHTLKGSMAEEPWFERNAAESVYRAMIGAAEKE